MTTDEELAFFEDSVRRLKVEYDIYFGGGSRRAPTELDWRVQGLIKKYSDSQRLSSPQRFKYNTVVQRYAIYSDLWRQKLRIKEEGYRRPQDALLGIQGLRTVEASQSPQGTGLAGDPDQSPQRARLAGDPDAAAKASRRAEMKYIYGVIHITIGCDFSPTDCKSAPFVVSRLGPALFRP